MFGATGAWIVVAFQIGIIVAVSNFRMILSAEALDIIAYLKTAPNKYVSILEISRRAGGRRRFEESPNWAKDLMAPLMDAGLLEVNARGHYRAAVETESETKPQAQATPALCSIFTCGPKIIGDDYFPGKEQPRIVGGDYFPETD